MDEPRSACSVSWPGSIASRWHVSAMRCWASVALSRSATIQPTTKRLNTSRIT
jgi:hypothetical protein